MKTIWKYPVNVTDDIGLTLPTGAEILDCQDQGNDIVLWALVDPTAPKQIRRFRFFGTGQPIDDDGASLSFVATVQLRNINLVFHLFELV